MVVRAATPYVLRRRDTVLPRELGPPWRWREFAAGFWISPRRYPDFGWGWLTRFLVISELNQEVRGTIHDANGEGTPMAIPYRWFLTEGALRGESRELREEFPLEPQ